MVALVATSSSVCVKAGAWTPKKADGIIIANIALGSDANRELQLSYELYGEVGLGRRMAFVSAFSLQPHQLGQTSSISLGARRVLYQGKHVVAAYQASILQGKDTATHAKPQTTENRFAVAYTPGKRMWFNSEVALRTCSLEKGVTFDSSFGYNFDQGDKLLVKAFNDGGVCLRPIRRLQIGYVRQIKQNVALEAGVRVRLADKGTRQEESLVIGLWKSF